MKSRWLIFMIAGAALACSANAQQLSEYRAPNDLESAYVGLAASLGDPSVCRKISPLALNRVRKPSLSRSLCYYQTALATGDVELCGDVAAVPSETGMMAWLDPKRCREQVSLLAGLKRPVAPPAHLDALLTEAGYQVEGSPQAYFEAILAEPHQRKDLESRVPRLPDFSSEREVRAGFTDEEVLREQNWVLGRALRLCFAGKSDAACDEGSIALLREDGLRRAGFLPPANPSKYRRLSEPEKGFLYLADSLRDPGLCDAIGEAALSVGWSEAPGLSFVPARSACRMRVAAIARDPAACASVEPVDDASLDGARATAESCRSAAAGGQSLFPPLSNSPDWSRLLSLMGYGEELAPQDREAWDQLAAQLSNPLNQSHDNFRRRLAVASKWYRASRYETPPLAYSDAELKLRAHQFSATRFHCSLDWDDVQKRNPSAEAAYWTPDRPSFSLLDQTGERVTQDDFKGGYMLAYFGFTYCPDVCPMSLSTIKVALDDLGERGRAIRPVFFTLDARRDTPEVLANYVKLFGETFVGLTGSEDEISRAARSFNVYFFAGDSGDGYAVEHTSYFYLVSPSGETIKYFDYGTDPHDMAAELAAILDGQDATPAGGVRKVAGIKADSHGGGK